MSERTLAAKGSRVVARAAEVVAICVAGTRIRGIVFEADSGLMGGEIEELVEVVEWVEGLEIVVTAWLGR